MKASGILRRIWRWIKWPVYIFIIGFVAFYAYGFYLNYEKDITDKAVAQINAHKLTLSDVEGTALPPVPDQAENDATVAGIDKNDNGIRDDVELAIFKKYPNDAAVRAAELQYAMALQTDITEVFNTGSWQAAAFQESRAFSCIAENYPLTNLKEHVDMLDANLAEVEKLQFNTDERKTAREKFLRMEVGTTLPESDFCDVSINKS